MKPNSVPQPNIQSTQTQVRPNLPTTQSPQNNTLLIVSIIIGFIVVGISGFYLGTMQNNPDSKVAVNASPTSQPDSQIEVTPTPISVQPTNQPEIKSQKPGTTMINQLQEAWSYKNNGECKVQFGIPPKRKPYYMPNDNPQSPVTEDSGTYWRFPRGLVYPNMLSKLNFESFDYKQANAMYAKEFGSGYIAQAVSVSCIPNTKAVNNNQQLIDELEKGFDTYNQRENLDRMEATRYKILSTEEKEQWGHTVINLTIEEYFRNSGGDPITTTAKYTIFSTPEYIYEIKVFGMLNDDFVNQTAQQIYDYLQFN